jgi:hypothetical protein
MTLAAFAALAALTLSPAVTPSSAGHVAREKHKPRAAPVAAGSLQSPRIADLYSARAKRRMANYLRMRLLEMRRAGLDRAAAVVTHRLELEALLTKP